MRPIKFRAWNEERKEMISADSFAFDEYLPLAELFRSPYFEFQQFTGLLDKNGKEIYEGDIMAIKFAPHYVERISWKGEPDAIAEVFWDYNGFRLKAKGKEDDRYADFWDDDSYNFLDMSRSHSEIIGNIYENPELLTAIN